MSETREEKRAYWAQHVKAWKASGETQRGYCRQHHIKSYQLTYWKQVFEPKLEIPTANGFVPVQVAPSPTQGLTVRLPSGVCIEQKVSGSFWTRKYAEAYCRISSYLQTMANQGYNPLVAIQMAYSGQIYADRGE